MFLEPLGTGEMHLGDSQALSGCKRRVKPKLVRKLTTPPLCFWESFSDIYVQIFSNTGMKCNPRKMPETFHKK